MKFPQIKLFLLISTCFIVSTNLISCKGKKSDAEIQTDIANKLNKEPSMAGITATVNAGVVTLTGECKDEDCRTKSGKEVKDIDGVKSVVNNIQIVTASSPTTANDTAPVQISSDEGLKSSTESTIRAYKDVQAEVKEGVITLRGSIKRDELQNLIISLNALKPKKIDNQLVIK